MGIINKIKVDIGLVIFGGLIVVCSLFSWGCAAMYNPDGTLTQETQAALQQTTQTAQAITSAVAPQAAPLVPLGGAAVGSILTLAGAIFYNKKKGQS